MARALSSAAAPSGVAAETPKPASDVANSSGSLNVKLAVWKFTPSAMPGSPFSSPSVSAVRKLLDHAAFDFADRSAQHLVIALADFRAVSALDARLQRQRKFLDLVDVLQQIAVQAELHAALRRPLYDRPRSPPRTAAARNIAGARLNEPVLAIEQLHRAPPARGRIERDELDVAARRAL